MTINFHIKKERPAVAAAAELSENLNHLTMVYKLTIPKRNGANHLIFGLPIYK